MENFVKTPIKFYPKKNFEKPKKFKTQQCKFLLNKKKPSPVVVMNTGECWPLWLAAGPIWATTSPRRPPRLSPPPRQLPPLLLREQPRQREHVVTGRHAAIQQQDHGVVLEGAAVCCSSDCRRPALQPGLVYHQQRVLAGRLEGG